jgi:hypothetical protein
MNNWKAIAEKQEELINILNEIYRVVFDESFGTRVKVFPELKKGINRLKSDIASLKAEEDDLEVDIPKNPMSYRDFTMTEKVEEVEQPTAEEWFENHFDCYADEIESDNRGRTQAMTRETFLKYAQSQKPSRERIIEVFGKFAINYGYMELYRQKEKLADELLKPE